MDYKISSVHKAKIMKSTSHHKQNRPKKGEPGSNGVPAFEKRYKGPGMCAHCDESIPMKQPYVGGPTNMFCCHYQKFCKLVSRNCSGIRAIKQTKEI